MFGDIGRLLREQEWDATDLAQEIYAILDGVSVKGIDGPLKINTQGSTPGIVFAPASLTQGVPFQVQNAGQTFNYTFGPQTGSGLSASYEFGSPSNQYNPTYGGNTYTFTGGGGDPGGNVYNFNPLDFPPPANPPGNNWTGGGGSGGGGGGGSTWVQFNQAAGDAGGAGVGGTQTAIAQVLSGSGTEYQMSVYGPGGARFNSPATAKGLSGDDKLDPGTWHTLTAYLSSDGSAEVYFTPTVYTTGRSQA